MRRTLRTVVLSMCLGLLLTPAPAKAEALFIPWAGVTFGNDQAEGDAVFGLSLGFMGGGAAGLELDLGYAPDFFGEAVDNHVLTGMINLILGIPVGGTAGAGVRPYVVAGAGLIRTSIGEGDLRVRNNDAGFNLGGGIMGFFHDRVGLRGDVRYFRNFNELDFDEFDFAGDFDFWRASIGVVFR